MAAKKSKRGRKKGAKNGTNVVFASVSKLGSEERTFSVVKGTPLSAVLNLAEIDGGTNSVKLGSKTITNLETPITATCRIVAIPNIKQGNDDCEELPEDVVDEAAELDLE